MAENSPAPISYLKPGRLADVLTLIQILAYDELARRSNQGLTDQLQRGPLSSDSWMSVGREHAEFFRVLRQEDDTESVALLTRLVLKQIVKADGARVTPTLTAEVTGHLMDLAIQLHDRQVQQRDRWKTVLVPVIAAILAAASAISAAVISTLKKPAPCPPAQSINQPKTAGG